MSLLKRAVHFRNALVTLYGAVGIFAIASLLGAIASNWVAGVPNWVGALTVAGAGAVLFAAISLAREATLSLRIIKLLFEQL